MEVGDNRSPIVTTHAVNDRGSLVDLRPLFGHARHIDAVNSATVGGEELYGLLERYGHGSPCCGLLAAALADDPSRVDDARVLLEELHQRVDRLPPERATELLELLLVETERRSKGDD